MRGHVWPDATAEYHSAMNLLSVVHDSICSRYLTLMRLERVLGDEDSSADKRERERKESGSFEVSIIIYLQSRDSFCSKHGRQVS
jgi:hypothetical protein